jgi:hypothetical protein
MADSSSASPLPLRRVVSELTVGGPGRIGSMVYGTLVVLTALTAGYAAERHHPWTLVEVVVTAVVVFWIAYVYAHALSETIEEESRLDRPILTRIVTRELGLLFAAVLPVVALILGAVGVVAEYIAIWVAIGAGIAMLSAEGVRYAHATGLGRSGMAVIVVMNLLLGLSVVALKVTLVH